MLVSRAVAMRSRTSTVGILPPRSTADNMLRLTCARAATAPSDRPRPSARCPDPRSESGNVEPGGEPSGRDSGSHDSASYSTIVDDSKAITR